MGMFKHPSHSLVGQVDKTTYGQRAMVLDFLET